MRTRLDFASSAVVILLFILFSPNTGLAVEKAKKPKPKSVQRTVQSKASTKSGREFFSACYATVIRSKNERDATQICGCVTRLLESKLNSDLASTDLIMLAKAYRGESSKAAQEEGADIVFDLERELAIACTKNPNATFPMED